MTFKCLTHLAFTVLVLMAALTRAQSAQTTVGTFRGAVVWANPPAVATGVVEQVSIDGAAPADALHVTIPAKASGPNDVQVLSQSFSLTNGQQYTLTYQAKADAPRTDPLAVRINAPDWHSVGYGNPAVSFGTGWRMYSETFTASNVGAGNNVVAFSFGDQAGSIWIANLKVLTNAPAAAVPSSNASQTVVANFVGAVVWAGPPAAAAGSLEQASIDDGSKASALRVDVSAKSNNPNDAQIFSQPFSLKNDQTYTLTYHAKCDATRTAGVSARINNADYHSIGYTDPAVQFGPTWKTYNSTFQAANAGEGDNVIAFSVGDQAGTIWIAGLTLTTSGPVDSKSELPGTPGASLADLPKNAYRILFVGNSITQHGSDPSTIQALGWDHLSGMAASSQSKDFVHLLAAKIQPLVPRRPVVIRIASLIPGGFGTPDYRLSTVAAESEGYNPNLVIIQHGEHEQDSLGADAIANTYNKLLDMFTTAPSHPQIVCAGVWSSALNAAGTAYAGWSATVEQTMHDICVKRGIPYVSVVSIAADPSAHGYGKDPGVRWHPNDVGHAKYADAIFAAVRPLIRQANAR